MLTDMELKKRGVDILIKNFGLVDTARFIALILCEPLDYTEWQREHFKDMTFEELVANVKKSSNKRHQKPLVH